MVRVRSSTILLTTLSTTTSSTYAGSTSTRKKKKKKKNNYSRNDTNTGTSTICTSARNPRAMRPSVGVHTSEGPGTWRVKYLLSMAEPFVFN